MQSQFITRFLIILLLLAGFGLLLSAQEVDMSVFHGMQPRNIGPAGMSGRVTAIDVVLEDTDIIYLGAAAGGLWRSENAGHTWTPIFENELAASVGDVTIFQKNPDIIYVGSGEGNPRNSQNSGWGMFKTIDGGKTWQHLGLEQTRQIHRVIVHPDNPDVVVAGVTGASWGDSEHRGIYKTTDGGKNWEQVLYINDRTGCADLVVDPSNPNRMLAAMWEHRRWPSYFKSGGEGSGLYLTVDGGDTWKPVTQGLPKGEIGRIGLSYAPSHPDIVYAYVESKENAVYRSTDGGYTWERRSGKGEDIGGRPFYYADIYCDTKNENRLYSIATEITVSEDGGKTWSVFAPGNQIHTDHHAWWSHPQDPEFIMVGHDGGFNVTHDRGKKWWFADNLPLAQFYHMRVDNQVPYNVYGGLQDNGSWRGPSQVRFKGGIRNLYWQRLSVGDGFDVVPDPLDNDYGYTMGQAGNLFRYHAPSGQLKRVKPVHPEGEYLRFNWNAGIAIDPFDQKTIYYGSQYLLKSPDQGQSWEIISPDLTTDDPEKQKFLESGGLTYDVTGAEFYTTIISIAPSPHEAGVIWVGTDDGNVQLTRNGGESWINLIDNFPGVPAGNWVAQIQPDQHEEGGAFVVFDDHRRNNWEPYIYHTTDYGKSWERIVDSEDVRGYALSFVQDPVAPELYFCGTEFGLYVSFDAGANWNEWTSGYPTVPTQDMVIHPRDHDLVIGTFGRAFWILDDIRPLREMTQEGVSNIMEEDLHLFPVPPAYLVNIGESIGYRHGKVGDAYFNGENRPYGALITYHLKEVAEMEKDPDNPLAGKVKVEVLDDKGDLVRTLYRDAKAGVNRFNWNLERDGLRFPTQARPEKPQPPRGGNEIVPGDYRLRISYNGQEAEGAVEVRKDPLLEITQEEMEAKDEMIVRLRERVREVTAVMDEIRNAEADMQFVRQKMQREGKLTEAMQTEMEKVGEELKAFKERIVSKDVQGIYRDPEVIVSQLYQTSYLLDSPLVAPSDNQRHQLELTEAAVEDLVQDFEAFQSGDYAELREKVNRDLGLMD